MYLYFFSFLPGGGGEEGGREAYNREIRDPRDPSLVCVSPFVTHTQDISLVRSQRRDSCSVIGCNILE
jgi:hypothetical protein